MIRKEIADVLKFITKKFQDYGIYWVIVGSVSLALQGLDLKPNDIDILTNKKDALKMNKLLEDYVMQPVKWSKNEEFDSYFGKFLINNVKVEIMGDLKIKMGGEWISLKNRLRSPKFIKIEGISLPVSPIKEQLEYYERRNKPKNYKINS